MSDHSTASVSSAASPPTLIDVGVNLAHDSFDADREAVIARAHSAGVLQMVITGATLEGSAAAIELADVRAELERTGIVAEEERIAREQLRPIH